MYEIKITNPSNVTTTESFENYDDAVNALESMIDDNESYIEGVVTCGENKVAYTYTKDPQDAIINAEESVVDENETEQKEADGESTDEVYKDWAEHNLPNNKEEETDEFAEYYSIYQPMQDYIKEQLDKRAKEDSLFAATYTKTNKSLKECVKYIVGEALESCKRKGQFGMQMFSPDAAVSMAIHYYDEDNIEIKSLGLAKPYIPKQTTYTPPKPSAPSSTTPIVPLTPKPKTAKEINAEKNKKAEEAVIPLWGDDMFE